MPVRVVVLSHHSLFADGIASRLRERPDLFAVLTIDSQFPAALQQLHAASPAIIVRDATDTSAAEAMPNRTLFEALLAVKIVQVDCNSDDILIYSSEQRRARVIEELMTLMQNLSPAPGHPSYA